MNYFTLDDHVVVITGGAGFLGLQHAEAICEAGGHACLLDINAAGLEKATVHLRKLGFAKFSTHLCDVKDHANTVAVKDELLQKFARVDGLINNAAYNPAMTDAAPDKSNGRFENYTLQQWQLEMDLGLTSAFICSQIFGQVMVENNGGVILNIASDLSVISPDQRIYKKKSITLAEHQPVKPVTYSVFKAGILGLTRYLSTYWVDKNIRVNALSPGGVYKDQDGELVSQLIERIPMGRMAEVGEYKGAVIFLLSKASSYITGINLLADGGRTVW